MPGCRRRSVTASWWVYSAVALLACSGPAQVRVGRIVIDAPHDFDQTKAREPIRATLQQRLEHDSGASFSPDARDATHVLQVRIRHPEPPDNATPAGEGSEGALDAGLPAYVVQVRLRPISSAPLYETTAPARGDDTAVAVIAAFDEAWKILGRQRQLDREGDDKLIAALADADSRVRDFVIVRLGDRRSRDAVVPLCDRLQREEKPELVLRIIGSLVSLGDPRAVEPMIELSNRREPDFVLQVVYAVGAIGGRTAEAYLVTMASGHPVEAVRLGAAQALGEMKRGRGSPVNGRPGSE